MKDQTNNTKIGIVVPCYNEFERLPIQAFLDFAQCSPHITFVMVDDGSQDGTEQLLQKLHEALPEQLVVHRLPENRGKAEAVREGLLVATEMDCELVGFWDADLATPLEAIDSFTEVLTRFKSLQAVIGCRLPLLGHQIQRNPQRASLGRAFAMAASQVLGCSFRDTQCGAKLFRNSPIFTSILQEPFSSSWIFDIELLARLQLMQQADSNFNRWVYEFPLEAWFEKPGSKLRTKHFFQAAVELLIIYRNYRGARGAKVRSRQWESMRRPVEVLELPTSKDTNLPVPTSTRRAA